MEMELEFFNRKFTELDPKQIMDHIPKIASGQWPSSSATLSQVYGELLRNAIGQPAGSGSGLRSPPGIGNGKVAEPTPAPFSREPSIQEYCEPGQLKCSSCGERARILDLYDGLYCPRCPRRIFSGRPLMKCPSCDVLRKKRGRWTCADPPCGLQFA